MNMWGFTTSLFGEIEAGLSRFLVKHRDGLQTAEYFLPDVVMTMLEAGKARVRVERTGERWFGVTYQEDKALVKQAIADLAARGVYPEKLWDEI